jgi:MoaA/NifB/PqqE/SkfB family radical SAM enzyme
MEQWDGDLVDPFGRTVRDLRISVTDRCNFRCTYCMPAEGLQWLPREDILTFEEIERLARICVERFGVDGIRLTGGEPTVRAHLPVLVEKLSHLRVNPNADSSYAGRKPDLSVTTNGATLRLLAPELRQAGLDRINISLDTIDPDRFLQMTRRSELHRVLDGIAAAKEAGFDPVKINAVVERGVNDDEIVTLAEFGRDNGVQVRFGAGRSLALPRRARRGRRHPDRDQALLRRLRPRPHHGGGAVPHLPVRHPRVRPPSPAQRGCERRRAGCGDPARGGHQVGRARHRAGRLRAPEPLHESDRRLSGSLLRGRDRPCAGSQ